MPTPLPTSIDDVIKRLDLIIQETIEANNYLGIFAYVYRRTTAEIQKAILEKRFENNERMEKFDVVFANRYIVAYENFNLQQPISKSWRSAFEMKDQPFTIIQHLMFGMNAHISFDLGIAAAEIAPGEKIDDLENDFMLVNQILHEIINEMQDRISKVSRLMFLIDWVAKRRDENFINYGIVKSRQSAWILAVGVSALELDPKAKNDLINKTDSIVAKINFFLKKPPSKIAYYTLRLVSFFEEKNISKIILRLKED